MISFNKKVDKIGEYNTITEFGSISSDINVSVTPVINDICKGHVLETISNILYSDTYKWFNLYQTNILKHPFDYNKSESVKQAYTYFYVNQNVSLPSPGIFYIRFNGITIYQTGNNYTPTTYLDLFLFLKSVLIDTYYFSFSIEDVIDSSYPLTCKLYSLFNTPEDYNNFPIQFYIGTRLFDCIQPYPNYNFQDKCFRYGKNASVASKVYLPTVLSGNNQSVSLNRSLSIAQ